MVITYTGKERCDILYFLIQIGIKTGHKIAVIDNSFTHDLFALYEKEDKEEIVVIDNLTVTKDRLIGKKAKEFDFVFIYEGLVARCSEKRDFTILAPTCERREIDIVGESFKEAIKNATINHDNILIIARDVVTRKISAKEIALRYELPTELYYDLDLDEKDYGVYVALTNNHRAKLNLSAQMFELMEFLAAKLYKVDAKTFKKLMK